MILLCAVLMAKDSDFGCPPASVDISAPVELTARARRQFLSFCSKISPAKYIFHRYIHELHVLLAHDVCLERSLLNPSIRFTPV